MENSSLKNKEEYEEKYEEEKKDDDKDEGFWVAIKIFFLGKIFIIKNKNIYKRIKGQNMEDYKKMCNKRQKINKQLCKEAIRAIFLFPWEAFQYLLLFVFEKEKFVFIMTGLIKKILKISFLILFYFFIVSVFSGVIGFFIWLIIIIVDIL